MALLPLQAELPTATSSRSYWHRNPSEKLLGHHTTETLPSTADIVVIGSGITGTFAARELVASGRSVVMLEAREACWSATGRNGGHCQPGIWESSPEVARFELATFQFLDDLITQYNIPCDWQIIGGIHAIYSEEVLEAAKKQIERLQMHPDLKDKAILITDPSELAARRVPEAIAAVYQPYAAKLWPYKLVSWLLEQLLNTHDASEFNLQTNTPVTHFQHSGSSIIVPTPRGEIVAKEVLLATNAYTSHLLPNMASLIVPVRAQVCALEPPQGAIQLPHSYVWMKGADHQYVIQRGSEKTSEEFIFGGERLEEGVSRDDEVDPMLSQALRWSLTQAINLRPGDDPEIEELELTHEWTGIMGYSGDSNPWVGRVPRTLIIGLDAEDDSAGLWMSAGYEGHGMPVAPRCGIAIAHMILQSDDRVKVPEQWLISEERVAKVKAKDSKLLRSHQDMTKMLPVVS